MGDESAEVVVAGDVLRQQDEVPTGAVDGIGAPLAVDGFVVEHRVASAAGTIGLSTDDRLESLFLLAVIEQVLDAVHVTMVGQRHSIHAGGDTLVDNLVYLG